MERKGKRKGHREKKRLARWTELGKGMDRETNIKIETVKDKGDVKKNRIMKRGGLKDGEKGKRETERETELCGSSSPSLSTRCCAEANTVLHIPSSLFPSNSSSI
jgi:hypothetical protein